MGGQSDDAPGAGRAGDATAGADRARDDRRERNARAAGALRGRLSHRGRSGRGPRSSRTSRTCSRASRTLGTDRAHALIRTFIARQLAGSEAPGKPGDGRKRCKSVALARCWSGTRVVEFARSQLEVVRSFAIIRTGVATARLAPITESAGPSTTRKAWTATCCCTRPSAYRTPPPRISPEQDRCMKSRTLRTPTNEVQAT